MQKDKKEDEIDPKIEFVIGEGGKLLSIKGRCRVSEFKDQINKIEIMLREGE